MRATTPDTPDTPPASGAPLPSTPKCGVTADQCIKANKDVFGEKQDLETFEKIHDNFDNLCIWTGSAESGKCAAYKDCPAEGKEECDQKKQVFEQLYQQKKDASEGKGGNNNFP